MQNKLPFYEIIKKKFSTCPDGLYERAIRTRFVYYKEYCFIKKKWFFTKKTYSKTFDRYILRGSIHMLVSPYSDQLATVRGWFFKSSQGESI